MNGGRGWSGWASSPDVRGPTAEETQRVLRHTGAFIYPTECMPEIFSFTFSILEVMLVKSIIHQVPLLPKRSVSRVIIPILIIMLFCGSDVNVNVNGKVGVFAEFH